MAEETAPAMTEAFFIKEQDTHCFWTKNMRRRVVGDEVRGVMTADNKWL